MKNRNIVIAIDGFSSCGKSTLAKALAKYLNFLHIDSGAMYRAVTLHFIKRKIDLDNKAEVENGLRSMNIDFNPGSDGSHLSIFLNGEDVSDEIRDTHISENVSRVSAVKEVRRTLLVQQQKIGQQHNIVMDGRDIGTTVFPYAQIKLFMTAEPLKRAERRYNEIISRGGYALLEEVFASLAQRDYNDTTREISPLICAPDAIVVDNTFMSEEEQLEVVLRVIQPLGILEK